MVLSSNARAAGLGSTRMRGHAAAVPRNCHTSRTLEYFGREMEARRKVVSSQIMASITLSGWIAGLLFIVSGDASAAQSSRAPVRIADDVTCESCTISLVDTMSIPVQDSDGMPESVRVDQRGNLWFLYRTQVPRIYDGNGRFVGMVGRAGRGPGEFMGAYDAFFVGDSIVVLDGSVRRATVLSPGLTPQRYISLPVQLSSPIVISWPDAVMAAGNVPTPEGIGHKLHKVTFADNVGRILRSFGPGNGEVRGPDDQNAGDHRLSESNKGLFWSIASHSYDIYQWDHSGRLLRELSRRPRWFSGPSSMNYRALEEPPPPHIAALHVAADGLLWVFIRVAAPTWREAFPNVPEGTREISTRQIAFDKLFRTTVEIIDPKTNRVVSRSTFDRYMHSVLPDGRVAIFRGREEQGEEVLIGRFELSGRG